MRSNKVGFNSQFRKEAAPQVVKNWKSEKNVKGELIYESRFVGNESRSLYF